MSDGIGIPGFEGADYSQLPSAYTIGPTDAYFAPDAGSRNPDTVQLHIKGPIRDIEYRDEKPDEVLTEGHLQYPVGKDEFTVGEGGRIQRKSGSAKIDKKTTYMWFIEEFANASGGREALNSAQARGLSARDAATWQGLEMRVVVKEKDYGVNRAGEKMVSQRLMPVWVKPAGAATSGPATGAPPAPPAYKEGDVVNGYELRGGQWVPAEPPPAPSPPPTPAAPPPPPAAPVLPPPPSQQSGPPSAPPQSSNGSSLDADVIARLRTIAQEVKGDANGMYMFFDRGYKAFPDREDVRAQIMNPALYESLVK